MEKLKSKELYAQFKGRLEDSRKLLKVTESELLEKDGQGAKKSVFFGKRPMLFSTMVRYFGALGYDINGLWSPDEVHTDRSVEERMKALVDKLLWHQRIYSLTTEEVVEKNKLDAQVIQDIIEGKDVTFDKVLEYLNAVKLYRQLSFANLFTYKVKVTNEMVCRITEKLSLLCKQRRITKGIQISHIKERGNLSSTTARRIEKDCRSVGIKKFISYATVLGIDVLNLVGKESSSYDADIRTVDLYNQLALFRETQEIALKYISQKLGMLEDKLRQCESYRADMSTYTMVAWLLLLNVNIEKELDKMLDIK